MAFKQQDRCIIIPTEDRDLYGYSFQAIPKLNADEEDSLFVNDLYQIEKCAASQDLFLNPVIKTFLIVIAVFWSFLILIILFVFLKYRTLKTQYSKLGEDNKADKRSPSMPGEIEL